MADIRRNAIISDCGKYRLLLTRQWDTVNHIVPKKELVFAMLNPSIADAEQDDPTARRCIGFGQRNGYDMIHVINLFTGRATKPDELFSMDDPEGPDCLRIWDWAKASSADIICAWGGDRRASDQARKFLKHFEGRELFCLGLTKDGMPRHPLYLPNSSEMMPFSLNPRGGA